MRPVGSSLVAALWGADSSCNVSPIVEVGGLSWGFPGGSVVKDLPASAGDTGDSFDPWVRRIPWRRARQPTPVFLLGKSRGQRNLEGYSSWDHRMAGHD